MLSPLFFLLFPLAMYGLHRAFPFHKSPNYVPPNYEQLGKFNAWSKLSGWIMLIFFGVSIYLIGGPLRTYRLQTQHSNGGTVFYVLPDNTYWYLLGWIPVLGLSAFIYTGLTKLYMGKDFQLFVDFYNQKVGYNPFKASIPLCGGIALSGAWLMFCLWNYSIYAYPDKVVIHWFTSTQTKTYTYKQVKKIEKVPVTRDHQAQYTVTFDDGQDWASPNALEDPNADRDIYFISKQSGVQIDIVEPDHR